ncbi:transposase [Budvicia aquatica]
MLNMGFRYKQMRECFHCSSVDIYKYGYSRIGLQRYKCKSCNKTFQGKYINQKH